jgi:hypothetical protein
MTSARNTRSLATTANKKMAPLSRETEHRIAAPLSPDGPHHAQGRRQEADPTTVRIEASVRAHTSRFLRTARAATSALEGDGLLIEFLVRCLYLEPVNDLPLFTENPRETVRKGCVG